VITDLIEGTPILTIKPTCRLPLGFAVRILGWAEEAPLERLPWCFWPEAKQQLGELVARAFFQRAPYKNIRISPALIEDVVSYESAAFVSPRPANEDTDLRRASVRIHVVSDLVTDEAGSPCEVLTVWF